MSDDLPDQGELMAQGMAMMGQVMGGTADPDQMEQAMLSYLMSVCKLMPTEQLENLQAVIGGELTERGA